MTQTNIGDYMNKKVIIILSLGIISFAIIGVYIVKILFIDKEIYNKKLENKIVLLSTATPPRGRIYDRNYKLLVDNKKVKTIFYKKETKTTTEEEIQLCDRIVDILDLEYEKVTDYNLREYWAVLNKENFEKLISEKERKSVLERKRTENDLYKLKISRISDKDISSMTEKERKSAYLYYLMHKGYSYEEKIIKKDVTDQEYAYIIENESNLDGFHCNYTWDRKYIYNDTLRTILGTVSTIPKEELNKYLKKGYDYNDVVGNSYLELQYENYLKGTKEIYEIKDNKKKIKEKAKRGNDIVLTIDIDLQQKIDEILNEEIINTKKETNTKYYNKSYIVLQDPNNGEILALAGRKAIFTNNGYKTIDYSQGIFTEPMTVGSVVKGASILVGYNNNAINIGSTFYDSCVKIKSTPPKCSWKDLGLVNDIQALALSSNIYQFKTAMRVAGYEYQYDMPFKVSKETFTKYRDMYHSFGLGVKTEVDLPIESLGYQGSDNQSGLLLDYVMGQYETYTPIQLSQYISTIANNGTRYSPHFLKDVYSSKDKDLTTKIYSYNKKELNKIDTDPKYLNRVKEGFYAVINASYGIGHGYIDTNYSPAGKTGTSESFLDTNSDGKIDTETISTSFIGYAPSNDPKITITVTSPDISYIHSSSDFMAFVTRRISKKATDAYFSIYPI